MSDLSSKIKLLVEAQDGADQLAKLFPIIPIPAAVGDALTCARALDTATRVNSAGAIEAVVATKPRITWELGVDQCPNLLVEKTRINLIPNEDSFIDSTGITYTTGIANNLINGVTSVRIAKNDATTPRYAQQTCSVTPFSGSTKYTLSRYFKYDGTDFSCSMEYNSATEWGLVSWLCIINIASTGVTLGIIAGCTAEVFPANDGYYRVCVYITTGASPSGTNYSYLLRMNGGSGTSVLTAGGQLEDNSIASSFINTTAGAVTANADVISKTGLSALIPQTKGGLFFDGYLQAGSLSDGASRISAEIGVDSNNRISIIRANNNFVVDVTSGGIGQAALVAAITNPIKNKRVKLIALYNTNDFKMYLNGALITTDTSGNIPSLSSIVVGGSHISGVQWDGLIKAVAVTDELTESEIAQLSSYPSFSDMASEMIYETV